MENSRSKILCPTCPVCDAQPQLLFYGLEQCWCPNDDCLVWMWTPWKSREDNLMDASPAVVVEDVPEV